MSQPSTPQNPKKNSGDLSVSAASSDPKPSSSSQASQSPVTRSSAPAKVVAETPQSSSKSRNFGDFFSFNPQATGQNRIF